MTYAADLIRVAAREFGISVREILSHSRRAELVDVRHAAMYVLRNTFHMSLPAIGRAFNRDHSTVVHACQRVDEVLIANDRERAVLPRGVALRDVVERLTEMVLSGQGRRTLPKSSNVAEAGFITLADQKGWRCVNKGWPDFLVLLGDGSLAVVEVKSRSAKGALSRLSDAQTIVCAALRAVGIPAFISDGVELEPFDVLRHGAYGADIPQFAKRHPQVGDTAIDSAQPFPGFPQRLVENSRPTHTEE